MNVKNIVLETDGINGNIWINAYKSEDKKELIITLAREKDTVFKLPNDAKPLMNGVFSPEESVGIESVRII